MYIGKSVLAVIPARGGSKGLPGKNIMPFLGKPLVAWTIEQARNSSYMDRIFVSTDSEEISSVAKEFGCEIPFLRPAELAADNSPTSDAVLHVLGSLDSLGESYDYVAVLEPTSPLRKRSDIDNGIKELLGRPMVYSLVSVGEVHTELPQIVKKIPDEFVIPYTETKETIYQRQQADKAFFPYGVIYLCRTDVYRDLKTFYTPKTVPLYIERWQNYEIDDELDFAIAEMIMQKYSLNH